MSIIPGKFTYMHTLCILVVVIFASACHDIKDGEILDGVKYYLYPNGNVKAKLTVDANGKRNGTATYYFEDGTIEQEANFVNDTLDGVLKNYFGEEVLYDEMFYKKGKLEGKYTQYYNNGQIKTTGQYINGLAEGKWLYYHEDGKLDLMAEYVNDNRDSYIEYFADGSIEKRSVEIDVWTSTEQWSVNKAGTISLSTQNVYAMDSAKVSLRIEGADGFHELKDSTINGISYHEFTPKASGTYKVLASVTDWANSPEVVFRDRDTLVILVK